MRPRPQLGAGLAQGGYHHYEKRISTELNGFPFLKHPMYVRNSISSRNGDRKNARIGLQADKHRLSYPMARRSISQFPANRIAAGSRGQFTGSFGLTKPEPAPIFT